MKNDRGDTVLDVAQIGGFSEVMTSYLVEYCTKKNMKMPTRKDNGGNKNKKVISKRERGRSQSGDTGGGHGRSEVTYRNLKRAKFRNQRKNQQKLSNHSTCEAYR
jgi:hypothetical protein